MKTISAALLILIQFSFTTTVNDFGPGHYYGAWSTKIIDGDNTYTCIKTYTPDYFIYAVYSLADKKFVSAGGGTWQMTNEGLNELYEFNTKNPELVGTTKRITTSAHDADPLVTEVYNGSELERHIWKQLDNGKSPLFGAWRITERERSGQMSAMRLGPRKTLKILSGTRFQWAAFNVETKEFFGTGGGTYETSTDKYVEHIDFFSRDNSRVGADLSFDFHREKDKWYHSGLSSKGNPIAEIWTLQDK